MLEDLYDLDVSMEAEGPSDIIEAPEAPEGRELQPQEEGTELQQQEEGFGIWDLFGEVGLKDGGWRDEDYSIVLCWWFW